MPTATRLAKPKKKKLTCPKCGSVGKTSAIPGEGWGILVCDLCGHSRLDPPRDDIAFEIQDDASFDLATFGVCP